MEAADTFVAQLFDTLGQPPPTSPFITYYWLPDGWPEELCGHSQDPDVPNCADLRDDGSAVVYSHDVLNRHEIVHAVHFVALGPSKGFLYEGLAQSYGDQLVDPSPWPEGLSIDEVLTGHGTEPHYAAAWRIVYSIVTRHGVDRLEQYWRRVATVDDDDAAGLREAFIEIFGEDIETMLAATASSTTCTIPLCNETTPIEDDPWTLRAPETCDDPRAVGGRRTAAPIIATEAVFALTQPGTYAVEFDGVDSDDGVALRRCDDTCDAASDELRIFAGGADSIDLEAGRWRVTMTNRSGTSASSLVLRAPDP